MGGTARPLTRTRPAALMFGVIDTGAGWSWPLSMVVMDAAIAHPDKGYGASIKGSLPF
jgi:hypothetical protein